MSRHAALVLPALARASYVPPVMVEDDSDAEAMESCS